MRIFAGKRKVLLGLIGVLLLGGAVAYAKLFYDRPTNLATGNEPKIVSNTDTDSDGLSDWEEELWHTDVHNPDTDSDGTKDGAEVEANRDPAKKAPGDELKTQTPTLEPESQSSYSYEFDKDLGETMTDTLGDNLAANYLRAKSTGSFDSETATNISQRLALEFGSAELYANIKKSDLIIVPTTDETMKNYLIGSYQAITYGYDSVGMEVGVLTDALQTSNYSNLSELEEQAKKYQHSLNLLLTVPVPSTEVNNHLALAQAYDTLVRSLRTIEQAGEDPILITKEMARMAKAMEQISLMYKAGQSLATRYWADGELPDLP